MAETHCSNVQFPLRRTKANKVFSEENMLQEVLQPDQTQKIIDKRGLHLLR